MADLEEHAIRRDKAFLVRLVVLLGLGFLLGILIFMYLTGSQVAGCAARGFNQVTDGQNP